MNQKSKGNISGIYKNAIDQGHTVGLQVNPNRDYDDMDADEIDDDVARQLDAIKNLTDTDLKYAKGPVTDGEPNPDLYNVLAQNDITMPYYNFCPYDHDDPMGEFESTIRTSNPKYELFIWFWRSWDSHPGDEPAPGWNGQFDTGLHIRGIQGVCIPHDVLYQSNQVLHVLHSDTPHGQPEVFHSVHE